MSTPRFREAVLREGSALPETLPHSPPMNSFLPDAARRVPSIKWLRALTRGGLGLPRNDVIRNQGKFKNSASERLSEVCIRRLSRWRGARADCVARLRSPFRRPAGDALLRNRILRQALPDSGGAAAAERFRRLRRGDPPYPPAQAQAGMEGVRLQRRCGRGHMRAQVCARGASADFPALLTRTAQSAAAVETPMPAKVQRLSPARLPTRPPTPPSTAPASQILGSA